MPREFGDPYKYPGTDVLKNVAGLRTAEQLARFEYEQSNLEFEQLLLKPVAGQFDLAHLKAIHKQLFQSVYEWAGETRTVNIAKGGFPFAQPAFIDSSMATIAADLAKENRLIGLDKSQFVQRLSHHYAELNAVHPFREGNGRATRVFIGQLAKDAGYELDQSRIENDKDQWNLAARRSNLGDLTAIKQILTEAVRPMRAVAFDHHQPADALAKHPELRSAFLTVKAAESYAAERIPDPAARVAFVAQTKDHVRSALDAGRTIPEPALKDRDKDRER